MNEIVILGGGYAGVEAARRIVRDTMDLRLKRMAKDGDGAPNDFLTLL